MSAVLEKPVIDEFGLSRFVLQFSPFIELSDDTSDRMQAYLFSVDPSAAV